MTEPWWIAIIEAVVIVNLLLLLFAYLTLLERKFMGRVTRISPQATIEQDAHVFIVRAEVENPEHELRTGMVGRAKILTGSRGIGYVLLREPLRWFQRKLWAWIP